MRTNSHLKGKYRLPGEFRRTWTSQVILILVLFDVDPWA